MIIDAKNLAESTSRAQEAIKTASYPSGLEQAITARLMESPFSDHFVAVRSSGTDEDSASHSFAGKMACQILCVLHALWQGSLKHTYFRRENKLYWMLLKSAGHHVLLHESCSTGSTVACPLLTCKWLL